MTADEYIAQLDEPRRGEVGQLHDLIRGTLPDVDLAVLREMLEEAGRLGPPSPA